jgi:hypothetical protein
MIHDWCEETDRCELTKISARTNKEHEAAAAAVTMVPTAIRDSTVRRQENSKISRFLLSSSEAVSNNDKLL